MRLKTNIPFGVFLSQLQELLGELAESNNIDLTKYTDLFELDAGYVPPTDETINADAPIENITFERYEIPADSSTYIRIPWTKYDEEIDRYVFVYLNGVLQKRGTSVSDGDFKFYDNFKLFFFTPVSGTVSIIRGRTFNRNTNTNLYVNEYSKTMSNEAIYALPWGTMDEDTDICIMVFLDGILQTLNHNYQIINDAYIQFVDDNPNKTGVCSIVRFYR